MKIIEVLQEKMKMSHIEIEERTKILEEINPLKKGKKKYLKEMSRTVQDLKMEIEIIKKLHIEATLDTENLGKRSGVTDASITDTRWNEFRHKRY